MKNDRETATAETTAAETTAAETTAKRRDFLKFASVGAVSGAAAAVVGAPTAEAKVESDTAVGYRETDHVKQVYDLARF